MSGIYIPGMGMPKSCRACHLATKFFDGWDVCLLLGIYVSDNSREDDCPLIEVPDHGDLIDRDETAKTLAHDYAYAAADMVRNEMPTIIPTDPDKEGEE